MNTAPMTHHHLRVEWLNDKHGPAIMLTQQDGYDEANEVMVHPWQLRALCEHFGLVTADPQAAKTIATLQRRMLALRDRIDALGDYMTNFSDHKHADLSHELNTVNLLADLADEWCADFQDATAAHPAPATEQPAPSQTPTPTQAPLL